MAPQITEMIGRSWLIRYIIVVVQDLFILLFLLKILIHPYFHLDGLVSYCLVVVFEVNIKDIWFVYFEDDSPVPVDFN